MRVATSGSPRAFRDGKLRDPMTDDIYYNVRRMKNLKAA
jgi:hypothetical protein